MEMSKVLDKLTREIIDHFRMPVKLCTPFIRRCIQMAYAIGFDAGRSTINKGKPVACLNEFGTVVKTYPTLSQAARDVRVDKTNISKAIHGKKPRCAGYYWKFLDSEDYDTYRKTPEQPVNGGKLLT